MNAPSTEPRWLRVQEAAELLGVSAATVRRWSAAGKIAGQRTPGGQRRFRVSDLEQALRADAPAAGERLSPDEPPSQREQLLPDHHLTAQREQLLLATSLELAATLDLSEILQAAARRLSAALTIPDCDIYELRDGERLVCLASTIDGVDDTSWIGHELHLAGWLRNRLAVETRRALSVSSRNDPRLSEAERASMRSYGQHSCLSLPLVAHDKVIGLVNLLDYVEREFAADDVATGEAVSQLIALAIERALLYAEVKRLHLDNLRALSSALSAKDYYTHGHANRVATYMTLLGGELGWPKEHLAQVQDAAFLHDIGKIGISERVLLKAGPLSSEEWELIRQHPAISAEIIRPLFTDELVAGVRHHHERFDGVGYPDGLAGEAIPLLARALCVVDSYDAMSCRRPYREALTYYQCLDELERGAGRQFDPQMVVAFRRVLEYLGQQRAVVVKIAQEAAALIDPAAHARLRSRADEASPAYTQMVAALRRLRDRHPAVRFITSFALVGDRCITIADTGETENEISHCGDLWLGEDDELLRTLRGQSLPVNLLTTDDFGVWVSGLAPVRNGQGIIVAAVSADLPAVESIDEQGASDHAQALTTMLQAAAMHFTQAQVEAITDGLTGLYNHRYLHERLEEELARARRQEGTLALLFCDCDQFKAYNDAYGHKVGDAALARIATIIASAGRRVDLAARYGGEEFVLALIDTDAGGALTVAERLRAEVEDANARDGRALTISIGIATYPDDASARDELIDRADWAMYAAKRAGGNRVLAFSTDGHSYSADPVSS
ncbi:MAG: diguanylate cyclase [Thermoleophilia bacterium]